MAEPKKISFGFSKSSKPLIAKPNKPVDVNIQYIDCLDSKSIQIKGVAEQLEKAEAEIVISLSTTSNKKNNRLAEIIKSVRTNDTVNISADCDPNQQNDLDSIAARELIEEARKSHHEKKEDSTTIALPLQHGGENIDEESTLDDYEAVPVSKYGAAMLRGMGWNPAKGIGKNEKVVATFEPKVRPRGMGLGVVLEKSSVVPSMPKPEEETKGSYVQVTSGPHRDMYGQIEGYNEETGRMILKLALGGTSLSMSEYMVKSVTKDEFTKNSRVLNASKYQEYKSNETRDTTKQINGLARSPKNDRTKTERTGERSRSRSRSRSPTRKHRYK